MPLWPVTPLSARERETLLWAARGKTYADTAHLLGLSWGTVKTHLDCAKHKLTAINMPQACALAVATGIISCEEVLEGSLLRTRDPN